MKTSRRLAFNMAWLAALAGLAGFLTAVQGQTNQAGAAAQAGGGAGSAQEKTAVLLKQAARHNDMEIALAEIGARKARNQPLKQYCLQLQEQEIQANNRLKPIARQQGVSLDQALTKHNQKELSRLERSSGADFDRTLATRLLLEQQGNRTILEQAAAQTSAGDFQQYAQQALPKLRQQLQQTEALAREVGVKESTIAGILRHPPKAVGGVGEMP